MLLSKEAVATLLCAVQASSRGTDSLSAFTSAFTAKSDRPPTLSPENPRSSETLRVTRPRRHSRSLGWGGRYPAVRPPLARRTAAPHAGEAGACRLSPSPHRSASPPPSGVWHRPACHRCWHANLRSKVLTSKPPHGRRHWKTCVFLPLKWVRADAKF